MFVSAIFVASALLHFVDPSHIEGLGLPRMAAYVIGFMELSAGAGLWTMERGELPERVLGAILLGAIGLYLKTDQFSLLALPALPLALLGVRHWVSRPSMSCACGLRHHPAPTELKA